MGTLLDKLRSATTLDNGKDLSFSEVAQAIPEFQNDPKGAIADLTTYLEQDFENDSYITIDPSVIGLFWKLGEEKGLDHHLIARAEFTNDLRLGRDKAHSKAIERNLLTLGEVGSIEQREASCETCPPPVAPPVQACSQEEVAVGQGSHYPLALMPSGFHLLGISARGGLAAGGNIVFDRDEVEHEETGHNERPHIGAVLQARLLYEKKPSREEVKPTERYPSRFIDLIAGVTTDDERTHLLGGLGLGSVNVPQTPPDTILPGRVFTRLGWNGMEDPLGGNLMAGIELEFELPYGIALGPQVLFNLHTDRAPDILTLATLGITVGP